MHFLFQTFAQRVLLVRKGLIQSRVRAIRFGVAHEQMRLFALHPQEGDQASGEHCGALSRDSHDVLRPMAIVLRITRAHLRANDLGCPFDHRGVRHNDTQRRQVKTDRRVRDTDATLAIDKTSQIRQIKVTNLSYRIGRTGRVSDGFLALKTLAPIFRSLILRHERTSSVRSIPRCIPYTLHLWHCVDATPLPDFARGGRSI